ncbi:AI-2E family transporter [Lucifera butyrica]|nr:AI-2E family transporter [Lucifera butyrica]
MQITKRVVRFVVAGGACIIGLYGLWLVRRSLYPFAIALFLAYLLNPSVCLLEAKGLKRSWAIAVVYFFVFGGLMIGGSQLLPALIREMENFGKDMPQMVKKGEEFVYNLQWHYSNWQIPQAFRTALDDTLFALEESVQDSIHGIINGLIGLLGHFIGILISPVLAFYLLHDWDNIKEGLLHLLPGYWRHEVVLTFKDVDKVLGGVIRGQFMVAVLVGVLAATGMFFLHLKYALLIGIFAGILDIIPYFGAFIGAAPAVAAALLVSPLLTLKVIVLFFFIHQLEGSVIQPKIIGDYTGLHPLSVIFFVFVGGELAGLTGMLLGVPVAAVIKVFLQHLARLLI